MKPGIFSRRSQHAEGPPGILYQKEMTPEANFWKSKLTMSSGCFHGDITDQERQLLRNIHAAFDKEPKLKDLLLDRDGNDFTTVFSNDPGAPQSEAIISYLQHFFQSRPQHGTVILVWDWEKDFEDLVKKFIPGMIIIDLAYVVTTRLFKQYAQQLTRHGAQAQLSHGDLANACSSKGKRAFTIPDFEELYAAVMSEPTRDISKEELYKQLRAEPAHLRASRLFDYYLFFMEFVAEHQLELTVMSEWDLNPVQCTAKY